MGSFTCTQDRVSKTKATLILQRIKNLSKLSSTWQSKWNPKGTERIQHATPLSCTQGSWALPSALLVLCWCSPSSPERLQTHTGFPTPWETLVISRAHEPDFSGYTSLQDLDCLCLSLLRKPFSKYQTNTEEFLVSWGGFTSSCSSSEADSHTQQTVTWGRWMLHSLTL